jgi:hypothetical protein
MRIVTAKRGVEKIKAEIDGQQNPADQQNTFSEDARHDA